MYNDIIKRLDNALELLKKADKILLAQNRKYETRETNQKR